MDLKELLAIIGAQQVELLMLRKQLADLTAAKADPSKDSQ